MRIVNSLKVFVFLSGCLAAASDQEVGKDTRLETARAQFEELKEDLLTPQIRFDERYISELNKLLELATASGNLELVLAIREESSNFSKRPPVTTKPSGHGELAKLQKIYDDQKAVIAAAQKEKLSTLIEGYKKNLVEIRAQLTKSGNIKDALTVQAELQRIGTIVSDAPNESARPQADPAAVKGRFVRISLDGDGRQLSLAEVQIFSRDENVAARGTASQSSVHSAGGEAALAVDGKTDGDFFAHRSTTHTEIETNPWWEVDLRSETEISKVVVWNRTDGDLQHHLAGFTLTILDSRRKPIWKEAFPTAPQVKQDVDIHPL